MAITQNQPISLSNTVQPIQVIPTTDVASSVKTGTSVIAPNPVDTIPKPVPTVVAITTPTTTPTTTPIPMYLTSADITRERPIIIAVPSLVSDTVKTLTGSPTGAIVGGGGGGGGGIRGGGASSEEENATEEGGAMEEPKKPNYLLLALLALGAYLAYKKFK